MSGPRALVWDNDGVLVDTERLFFTATSEALGEHGVELDPDLYIDYTMRRGASLFDLVAARGVDEDAIRALRARRDHRYAELIRAGVRVLEGVREALTELQGLLPMAVVTSSGREHFDLIHEPLGLLDHFEFTLAAGDYEHHKPHPDPYLTASRRIGLAPKECWAVEDSERGLRAALAAGMRCIVVPSEFSAGGDFSGAHAVVDTAHEVTRFFR